MFDLGDFQNYLNQPPAYWEDFGKRCATGLRRMASALNDAQLEHVIGATLARMATETGKTLDPERAAAFTEGMRESYVEHRGRK
jgi:hypothetical protein